MLLILYTSSGQDEKLMQAARLPCRPVRALYGCKNQFFLSQHGSPAATNLSISFDRLLLSLPRPYRSVLQVASLRTRAPSEQYSVPRRVTVPHAAPQFLRKWARPAGPGPVNPPDRVEMPTEVLERELMWLAQKKPFLPRIEEILHILVQQRLIRPKVAYYQALILGNADLARGSVANVEHILQDMKEDGIPIGASIYNAVLKVLSILPNRDLREHILQEMSRQWIRVTSEAKHDVVAGMIRGDELELAQEQMAIMQDDNIAIQPWLYVLMVHGLCEKKDFDALLHLVYDIHDNRKELPRSTWLFLLQQASGHGDYHLTEWIWLHHVEPMYIRPDTQSCVNTLKLAAQEGNPRLAESAWGIMEVVDREAAAIHHHLLVSAYEKAGVARNPYLARGSEVFAAFSEGLDHNKAFFDPKLAIDKRISRKKINPARLERSRTYKQSLKNAQKRAKKLKRQGR